MVALPAPATVKLSTLAPWNCAVTLFVPSITTPQVDAVPAQSPLHPLKADPLVAAAVRVTWVRAGNVALQAPEGQLRPAGVDVTLPWPVTVRAIGLAKSAAMAV